MSGNWKDEVLAFWFSELTNEQRFGGSAEVDDQIRTRFAPLLERLAQKAPAEASSDPETALAAVIVYDQFSRNIHRRTPAAFATDALAMEIARNALDRDFDADMGVEQRQFLYMPFMHSEVLADQERCVDLFKSLGNAEGTRYAEEHRDIVARFGRFPHRNRALARETSAEEAEFLGGHEGFGQ